MISPLDGLISAALEALQAQLGDLRTLLAAEVRTRRIVITDDDGFERIVAAANDGVATVTVFGRSDARGPTCVELFATDPIDAAGTTVGVNLTKSGDVVATFDTSRRGWSELWINEHDAKPQT